MNKEEFIRERDYAIKELYDLNISDILKYKIVKLVTDDYGKMFDDSFVDEFIHLYPENDIKLWTNNLYGTIQGIVALNNEVSKDMFVYLMFVEQVWKKW